MTYNLMRAFADSWGLVAMALFFVGCIAFALRPGSRRLADEAARIPLEDE
ncbi:MULTISPECIES: cbb3-type cytochrome c oxidase subunit 3 [Mesorhizobium]|jgi:cytochrome c oxidase cbb3-type subunit 4|uniref:CcoQ/FixQ family Cbb3-type cytochrome c oxidase assembly chaperone n=4 Tax=Mesorhizobium TaxID=68287 RepID=A0A271KCD9_9HYPH|nr:MULTISPECIES: cbb3-type cytochrome c oxidase subunit 3 [Mesorhizobium]RUU24794.1 cbb3-type cytochrome c oxidase subunit 3 [Mesorhizobium sp. M7A.T.Ca.TU.009.01.3.2]RUU32681.1 cbb3-type cytochrome c oxidase subunit 3 [Mesorhizobium sp. M6A.T.Ca.TU.002.02.2.1]RUU66084.1 cbb3-type cytochrome c oxidase subunit 3 [Mesorhizobium sp. M7A.T.Ca.TU.009.01.1.1]RUU90951.1 cbb3-type cytochrome c oxidase subunit 3 [Mesorhizobium sp. M7A.T.Ca.TU.009.01.1.2]RUV14219.1 cbb3-type cytochrome c oxidase subunit